MTIGVKEGFAVCAAGVVLARLLSWTWKASNECVCAWCKRKLPKRIILVRHGQSEGNDNPDLYREVPDNAMHLTALGRLQARAAGKCMKEIIGNESVRCIVSPCVRTIETFEEILTAWGENAHDIPWTEEPRIREQDFGNFQDPDQIRQCKLQRRKFGGFFYRFPSGESPADVYDRISSFLESLHRMFARHPQENYILVTHGVAIRVLLMRYFKLPVVYFDQIENFHNAEFVVLEHVGCGGSFKLVKQVHANVNPDTEEASPVESPMLRFRTCDVAPLSKYASSFEKEALYTTCS
ncbi:hypothetical protein H310_01243 [Aphanomyces invadans]|uniref:Uncharacterized protein n=1 Tax=Aphanomyces invadans TaxID=157072 RepID=A0A024USR7_9STRA|nr:hypothetical protein H310_01243 [Aphanomyces invadans]ETW08718.1 hypothetical protein H310_01243 [Aphanomyces invadans]|eukprot:XP_008862523.1 hypothetical protein H310_01243 [Aphanomyces invadans]